MEKEYPKRLFRYESETQVQQISNSRRMSILTYIKTALQFGLDGDNNESDNRHAHEMKKRKTKHVDHGAETRKKMLFCERASTSHVSSFENMKFFIKDTLGVCFKSFGDNIDKRFSKLEDDVNRFTPFKRETYVRNPGKNGKDAILVFVSEDRWNAMEAWSRNPRSMNFGPVVIDYALLARIIGRWQWLCIQDMDATMYLFRENTSLGRLKSERVGFMNCMFSSQITEAYKKFLADKKNHSWDSMILAYANGEMPAHGKTRKKWASDFDKIYTPMMVNNDHWIALCINFVRRTIEVFDCCGNNYKRQVEPFAITIPRIVKEIQPKSYGKNLHLSPYSIIHVSVPQGLNKSHSDCGVYALKYIESHLLQLGTDLINDNNIMEARMRIAVDLWEAASSPVIID